MLNKNKLQVTSYKLKVGIFLFVYCLLPAAYCFSQSVINSPYSRFGLGDLQNGSSANNFSMGGISTALQNDSTAPFNVNYANPASHASSRLTIFDFGLLNNGTQLSTNNESFFSNRVSLAYAAFVFPVAKWWGTSIGIRPYSNVGYKIYTQQTQDSIGTVNYSYDGQGGINQVYWGNGFRIKNLYFGANVSYLFGNLIYTSTDSFPDASYYENSRVIQTTRVSNLYFTFGMQFRKQFKKGWALVVGATGSAKTNLNVEQETLAYTFRNQYGVEVVKDTLTYETANATIAIPMTIGGGIVLKKSDKLLVGFDYSMQNWSAFNSFDQQGILKNSQKYALGIQYVPNKNAGSKEPYFKKVFYRAGLRYTNSFLDLGNTPLKEYAFSFGAGFPLRKIKVGETYSQSIINAGFEIGQFGTTDNQLIRERYFKAVVGFTLNDRWFIKRKYD